MDALDALVALAALCADRRYVWHHVCYRAGVIRTTIYLPEDVKRALERLARRRGVTEAAIIREAVGGLLEAERPRPTLPLFESGDPTLAERVDEALGGYGE